MDIQEFGKFTVVERMEFKLESLGRVSSNHPTWSECLELEAVNNMKVSDFGYFKFLKGGNIKNLLVVRLK